MKNISFLTSNGYMFYICYELCKLMGINITQTSLNTKLEEHPKPNTMLQIGDVLEDLGISNLSLQLDLLEDLKGMNYPLLIQVFDEQHQYKNFSILYSLNGKKALWLNPQTQKKEYIDIKKLQSVFTGYVQIFDSSKGWKHNSKNEIIAEKLHLLIGQSLPIIVLLLTMGICVSDFLLNGSSSFARIVYVLLLLLGSYVSWELFDYESGNARNIFVYKMCSLSTKNDCSAVLTSKYSQIYGINLSHIGLSYFFGSLLSIITLSSISQEMFIISAWINVFSFPYIVFSLYYQIHIKHWCPLCLSIIVVLLLLNMVAFGGSFLGKINALNILFIMPFIVSVIVVFILFYIRQEFLKTDFRRKYYMRKYIETKYHPEVMKTMAFNAKKEIEIPENLGIVIGNPKGKIRITKVCNPYCEGCIMSHGFLDNLLDNNSDIRLQVIYNAKHDEGDPRNKPVKILLAKYKESPKDIRSVLDTWYFMENQDYETLLNLYPVSEDILEQQVDDIKYMYEWCKKAEIEYTPTLIINGHRMSKSYYANDLKFML